MYTIGHSNRSFDEFIDIIKSYRINVIVDVRRFPSSRVVPHFNRENLEDALRKNGIGYVWLGSQLGGFRKPNYVSYMETHDWDEGYKRLKELIRRYTLAIMCRERLWFKCHRRFIANKLVREGHIVVHIIDKSKTYQHRLQLSLD